VLGDAANLTGGLLSGFGTVHGAVANSGGIVAPGDGVTAAILSIGSNYTQGAAGTLSILLTPSTASRLAVTGVASVDGTLLLSGSFARGQSYTILTAAGVSGAFSSVSDPTLGNTTFKVTYGSDDIAIMAPSSWLRWASVPTSEASARRSTARRTPPAQILVSRPWSMRSTTCRRQPSSKRCLAKFRDRSGLISRSAAAAARARPWVRRNRVLAAAPARKVLR
jgi:hypothetical protein